MHSSANKIADSPGHRATKIAFGATKFARSKILRLQAADLANALRNPGQGFQG